MHGRGISSLKACVVCGANDLGDSFCRLAGRGRPTDAEPEASLEGLGPCERVSTDGHSGYAPVLSGQAAAGRYENTWAMLVSAPQPFWDYWEGQAPMSTVV